MWGHNNVLKPNTKYFVVVWSGSSEDEGAIAFTSRTTDEDSGTAEGWEFEHKPWSKEKRRVGDTREPVWLRDTDYQMRLRVKG